MDHRLYNVLNNLGNPVMNNKTQNLRHLHKRKENKKIPFDNISKKSLNRNHTVIFF